MVRRRVVVEGEVQGVGYRWATRDRAVALGVSGFVQNRHDGSVLAEIEGDEAAVDALMEWMRQGPPGARVDALDGAEIPEIDGAAAPPETGGRAGFEIRR